MKKIIGIIVIVMIIIGISLSHSFFEQRLLQKEVENIFLEYQNYCYFYNHMNDQEKEIYQRLYYVIQQHQEYIHINTEDVELIKDILLKISYDHPEFYYVNTSEFEYSLQHNSLTFYPHYYYTDKEVKLYDHMIEEKTNDVINQIKQIDDQLLQIQMIYEYIVDHVHYQMGDQTDQTLIGSLIENQAVCAGYARAYQYLLNQVDIDCTYIVGKSIDDSFDQYLVKEYEGHAWVMIHYDNDYYYNDVTWADKEEGELQHTCYGYMLMSSDEMERCYIPKVSYEKTKHLQTNYFIENETYMTTYDQSVFLHAVTLSQSQGKHVAEIMCANDEIYQQVKYQMEHGYLGYEILNAKNCWSNQSRYSCNDDLRIIELSF